MSSLSEIIRANADADAYLNLARATNGVDANDHLESLRKPGETDEELEARRASGDGC